MSLLEKFEKIDNDIYTYEKITIEQEQVSRKHLMAERDRLIKRIKEIESILLEIDKVK